MISISFTASREGFDPLPVVVTSALWKLPDREDMRYVTGGCRGGDAEVGRWLHATRPRAHHMVIVPADRSQADEWWLQAGPPFIQVIEMPPGSTYRDRNTELVKHANGVIGLPAWPEADPRSRRSGTWQTIRLARKAGKLSWWMCVMPPHERGDC